MPDLIRLCRVQDIPPGEMRPYEVEGAPSLAVFNVDGHVFVTSNICTHDIATLTDGLLEGHVVECPLHGGAFDIRTGVAERFPCSESLRTYPVVIENGHICIWL